MSTTPENEAAFVMEADDRFHSIVASDPILFEQDPDAESFIVFFVIRRKNGGHDVVNLHKIFKNGKCIRRTVQTKNEKPGLDMGAEIAATLRLFSAGIEKESGYRIKWNTLDLSAIQDMHEQVRRIREWGRVGVSLAADIPGLN